MRAGVWLAHEEVILDSIGENDLLVSKPASRRACARRHDNPQSKYECELRLKRVKSSELSRKNVVFQAAEIILQFLPDFLFCTYIVLYILYMMTSVGSERPRGTRDKAQISPTQLTQPQKPVVQATAEQIRLAQMIYDKNDVDFEDKVKQLMEVTGKNQDDCIVALHDCNGDVNRAINILLEGNSDTSWGKSRKLRRA
ncbi:Ubiquitin-associated protein 2 [Varanus komodoensis]|nr:Ubiquitin-associated protein 2 [Varanus komodoensis]